MNNRAGLLSDLVGWLQSDPGLAAMAGAAGGLVRWVTLREHWRDGIASLVVGAICALYLGPIVEPMLAPIIGQIAKDESAAGFSSFVCGLGGIGLSGFVIDALRRFNQARGGADEQK